MAGTSIHCNACAWRGWWERPDGQKFEGAILMLETRYLKPVIAGLPIGPDASGQKTIAGPLGVLSAADCSLKDRSHKLTSPMAQVPKFKPREVRSRISQSRNPIRTV